MVWSTSSMSKLLESLVRAKGVILWSFCLTFLLLLVLLAAKPAKYQAHVTFLVRNERAESMVSADPSQNSLQQADVLEERINSAVELLESAELLQAVVKRVGLQKEFLHGSDGDTALAIEKATRKLSKRLEVVGVRKSALVEVTYTSTNRGEAKLVLDALSAEYLASYARLYNTSGAASFYQGKSRAIERSLQEAEAQRAALIAQSGYRLLPDGQRLSLEELVDLEKGAHEAETSLAETSSRLSKVRAQQGENAVRILTQVKSAGNQYAVEQLNTKLADLQIKRTELRTKFVDGDPLLKENDQEIAETKAALSAAAGVRSEDTTSDINPLRQTLDREAEELSQTKAGLMSRLQDIDRRIGRVRLQLGTLERTSVDVDSLNREIKVFQDSIDLYQGKALAAQAAEDLDPEKFSNIVEATHPTVPVLPAPSPFNLGTAFLFSLFLSLTLGVLSQWNNRDFEDETESRFRVLETAGRAG